MHLTSSHLKQIIKEELQKVITEGTWQKETRQMTRELFDMVIRDVQALPGTSSEKTITAMKAGGMY